MSQTLEQTILELRRSLPEEFVYTKYSQIFDAQGKVSVMVDCHPLLIRVASERALGIFPVRKGGAINVQAAVKLALEHFNRPTLAAESVKRKEAKSEKQQALEFQVQSSLEGFGIPVECLSENGRRGLQISVNDREINLKVSLKTAEELRCVLEALPQW